MKKRFWPFVIPDKVLAAQKDITVKVRQAMDARREAANLLEKGQAVR